MAWGDLLSSQERHGEGTGPGPKPSYTHPVPRLASLAPSLLALTALGCNQLTASPEPMGEPAALGGACEPAPVATGTAVGDISPNLIAVDQYGETIDLYEDLCDRHVILVRAGFD